MTMRTIATTIDVGSFDGPGGTTGGVGRPVAGAHYLMDVETDYIGHDPQWTLDLLYWRRQRSDVSAQYRRPDQWKVARKLPSCGWQESPRPWRAIVMKLAQNKDNAARIRRSRLTVIALRRYRSGLDSDWQPGPSVVQPARDLLASAALANRPGRTAYACGSPST
jgi:hypothetical protein